MTARRFSALVGLALLLLAGANLAVHRLTARAPARMAVQAAMQSHPDVKVAFFGNSLMAGGVDPKTFDAALGQPEGHSLNAALGATTALTHLLLERAVLEGNRGIKTVIYGYMDFQLTDGDSLEWWKALGNETVIFYREPDLVSRHLITNGPEKILFYTAKSVPMFVERAGSWGRVEMLRRRLGGIGLPEAANNRFGRVEDFAAMEMGNIRRFSAKAVDHVARLNQKTAILNDIITFAQDRGCRMWFVLMPLPIKHRELYATPEWKNYHEGLSRLLQDRKTGLLDASDWIPDEALFVDALHLGAEGAAIFSRKLAESLPKD